MKKIKYVFASMFLLLFFAFGKIDSFASITGFKTEDLPSEKIDLLISNINLSLITEEPAKKAIKCFDVSEDGLIAVGYSNLFENKTICVYTSEGDFQYGYTFESGSNFGVEFNDGLLNIYLVRSFVAIAVNPSGEVESVLKIQNVPQNNAYWDNTVFSTKRKIGNTEYSIESDIGAFLDFFTSSYSRIVITNENGERSIIYDVNDEQLFNMVLIITGFTAIFCLCAVLGYKEFRKHKYGG